MVAKAIAAKLINQFNKRVASSRSNDPEMRKRRGMRAYRVSQDERSFGGYPRLWECRLPSINK